MTFSLRSFSEEKVYKTSNVDDEKAYSPELLMNGADKPTSLVSRTGEVFNASGHQDQLRRQYSLLSICGLALTIDNAWVALGGSLTISLRTLLHVVIFWQLFNKINSQRRSTRRSV